MVGRYRDIRCDFLWGLFGDVDFNQWVIGDGNGINLIQVVACNFDLGSLAGGKFIRRDLLDAGLPLLAPAIVLL